MISVITVTTARALFAHFARPRGEDRIMSGRLLSRRDTLWNLVLPTGDRADFRGGGIVGRSTIHRVSVPGASQLSERTNERTALDGVPVRSSLRVRGSLRASANARRSISLSLSLGRTEDRLNIVFPLAPRTGDFSVSALGKR